mgnify:FL=1|tara:strand:- start:263 stop:685 length:423 start_codon:yes stop_codon:yes gene_type:complete
MTKNFKIIESFIKDMSSETSDIETFLIVQEKISKYLLNIDINSKALKNGIIEVNIVLKFIDKPEILKKSYFEIIYASVVKVDENISDKKEMEKIILCDVPNEVYPKLEKIFMNLLTDSGFPGIKFEKKIDFNDLYKQRSN